MGFKEFYEQWKDTIRVTTSADVTWRMYAREGRDLTGFDALNQFIAEHGEEWAVMVAGIFERRSALAGRLDTMELAKFRMVFDRHMLNLSRAEFDEAYLLSSDERALFLIHQRVPPVRVSSALTAAKNATIDMVTQKASDKDLSKQIGVISAFSTMFMIELNHIMRAYVYFANANRRSGALFDVVRSGDDELRYDYTPPMTNAQMSMPDKKAVGVLELF